MKTSHTCPPVLVNATVDGAFGFYDVLTRGWTDYITSALARRATPVDLACEALTWWSHVTRRDVPQWASPNRVVAEWPVARLRDFSDCGRESHEGLVATDADAKSQTSAVMFLPPQAGHASCIVDYDPVQSQVRTALEAGMERVFSLEWIGASQATKDSSIQEYVEVIAAAIAAIGSPVHLVGDCQGGWLATIFAALHPDDVATLTIAGAPIDFHAGDAQIHDWMGVLAPERDLAFYQRAVEMNNGVLPGEFLLAGFIAMQPAGELDKHLQLLAHINEPAHVARYRTFETWFQHTQPIPGAFYLWIIEHLFQNNELIAGTLSVGERLVDLSNIKCPLYLLAGSTDHITPPPQVYALAEHAGTADEQVSRRLAEGGHLGLFMGKGALVAQWAPLFAELSGQSCHDLDLTAANAPDVPGAPAELV